MAKILEGIRVFDLTIAAVGPWATKLLGALGADVIKVEAPGGDRLSHAVPPTIKGSSVLYISANHNKRMIELDLCEALKLAELISDPRFETNSLRVKHRAELIPILAERLKTKPAAWWTMRLNNKRVPNGPFLTFEELRHHPQVLANGHIVEIDTPHWGRMYVDGLPWKFERAPAGPIRAGGKPGEHTAELLTELGIVDDRGAGVSK
jgi:crotonobetainyl-CoA:carnitine CoA-transferase CaiB-like acyl-CoA transferase